MYTIIFQMVEGLQGIPFESAIEYYFAILGVFVTLISITTALNQEVRQKLLVKYYSKVWWIILYVIFMLCGFLAAFVSLIFNLPNLREALIVLVFALFLFSLIFVIQFMRVLNRRFFNQRLLNYIGRRLRKGDQPPQIEAFKDFVSNIGYVMRRNADLEDEEEAFRGLVKMSIWSAPLKIDR